MRQCATWADIYILLVLKLLQWEGNHSCWDMRFPLLRKVSTQKNFFRDYGDTEMTTWFWYKISIPEMCGKTHILRKTILCIWNESRSDKQHFYASLMDRIFSEIIDTSSSFILSHYAISHTDKLSIFLNSKWTC